MAEGGPDRSLIYAGAFDQFGNNRAEMIASLPEFLSSVELSGDNLELFEALAPKIQRQPDLSLSEKLEKENEYLGAYLSGHPVEQYHDLAISRHTVSIGDLAADQQVNLLVYVTKVRTIRTKRGDQMAFVTGSDLTGEISLTVFPNLYRRVSTWLEKEQVVFVSGKTETNRGGLQVVANNMTAADQLQPSAQQNSGELPPAPRWFLRLDQEHDTPAATTKLFALLSDHTGDVPVILYRLKDDSKRVLAKQYWPVADEQLQHELVLLLGEQNVVFQRKN